MSYIDPLSLQPPRFGQIYSDRSLTATGMASWSAGTLNTSGLAVLVTPEGGGALAVNVLPDAAYSLPTDGYSLWIRVYRTPGTNTLVYGTDIIIYNNLAIPTPMQDFIPLFIRYAGQLYAYGGLLVGPRLAPLGGAKASDYDLVVGQPGDPRADYTNLALAIQNAQDGFRILVLAGTYGVGSATNGGVDANAAFAWTNKTLTIEGVGWGTQIENTGSLTRAFAVQSGAAGVGASQGNGSRILNLVVTGFSQAVNFDGNASYGIFNCNVDIWQGNTSSFQDPTVTGGGTSDDNEVKLHLFSCSGGGLAITSYQVRHYVLGNSNSTYTEATNNVIVTSLLAGTAGGSASYGYAVVTDPNSKLSSLEYAASNIPLTFVFRAGDGTFNATNATFSALSPGQAVVTNGSVALASLPYTSANTANTLVERDSNGSFAAGYVSQGNGYTSPYYYNVGFVGTATAAVGALYLYQSQHATPTPTLTGPGTPPHNTANPSGVDLNGKSISFAYNETGSANPNNQANYLTAYASSQSLSVNTFSGGIMAANFYANNSITAKNDLNAGGNIVAGGDINASGNLTAQTSIISYGTIVASTALSTVGNVLAQGVYRGPAGWTLNHGAQQLAIQSTNNQGVNLTVPGISYTEMNATFHTLTIAYQESTADPDYGNSLYFCIDYGTANPRYFILKCAPGYNTNCFTAYGWSVPGTGASIKPTNNPEGYNPPFGY